MKNILKCIGIIVLMTSCSNIKESRTENFINDALVGVVNISNRFEMFENGELVFSNMDMDIIGEPTSVKYAVHNPLLFYNDGTCRHCYSLDPIAGGPIGTKLVYTIFYWEVDKTNATITLSSPELLTEGHKNAVGVLKIKEYQNGYFKLSGSLPNNKDIEYSYNLHGQIGDSNVRANIESKYKEESFYTE